MTIATEADIDNGPDGGAKGKIFVGALALIAIVAGGIALVFWYIGQERARELLNWQIRLGIVAENRAAAVNEWIGGQFDVMQELADNASLQLYMTELMFFGDAAAAGDELEAEAVYLQNLLTATAQRTGFVTETQAPEINANVESVGEAGIAVVKQDGQLLVATRDMPPMSARIQQAILEAAEGQSALIDLHAGPSRKPTIGFVVPVYSIADGSGSEAIGFVIGLRVVGDDLFAQLPQPGELTETSETFLVRKDGGVVEYISPLRDGTAVLERKLSLDTPNLAAAYVVEKPGGFGELRSYDNADVLVTGRALAAAPWYLVRSIHRNEALADSEGRFQGLIITFILIILGIAGAIIAVWRHGTSVRAAEAAAKFQAEAERSARLHEFIQVVTDSQPTIIFAVDTVGQYTFANEQASLAAGIDREDMYGKSLAAILGPATAKPFDDINNQVYRDHQPRNEIISQVTDEGRKEIKADAIPLFHRNGEFEGILMILQDITQVVLEKEKREATMRDLVRTLVSLVDQRDPYSADQSARVAEVSVAIAKEMGLSEEEVRTVDIAGNLMNLGKMLVPAEVLTKTGKLSDEEMQMIKESVLGSARLIENVSFDLPVAETLRQLQETWDGTGFPNGISGYDINVCARVVSVANTFVSMVSARAYRDGMPFTKAVAILMEETDTRFDRKPVSALANYLDNRGGRMALKHLGEKPVLADDTDQTPS